MKPACLLSLTCCSAALPLEFLPTGTIFFVYWISQNQLGFEGEECTGTAVCLPSPYQLQHKWYKKENKKKAL